MAQELEQPLPQIANEYRPGRKGRPERHAVNFAAETGSRATPRGTVKACRRKRFRLDRREEYEATSPGRRLLQPHADHQRDNAAPVCVAGSSCHRWRWYINPREPRDARCSIEVEAINPPLSTALALVHLGVGN
jgi:hypothetical protein